MALDRHIDEDLLERYSMHGVSGEECAEVEEHLLLCEPCRTRLTDIDGYVQAMRAAAAQLHHQPGRRGWFSDLFQSGRLAWAAGFALALLLVAGLQWQSRRAAPALPAEIALVAVRGDAAQSHSAPEGRSLRLLMDASGLPADCCRVEVVDRRGGRVFTSPVKLQGDKASLVIPPRDAGIYFVRLYAVQGDLLREFSLPVGRP